MFCIVKIVCIASQHIRPTKICTAFLRACPRLAFLIAHIKSNKVAIVVSAKMSGM
jgi:hypothetical protein